MVRSRQCIPVPSSPAILEQPANSSEITWTLEFDWHMGIFLGRGSMTFNSFSKKLLSLKRFRAITRPLVTSLLGKAWVLRQAKGHRAQLQLEPVPGSPPHPHPSLQEQLCQLYPRLKVLAFGAKPESTLHTYFPSFLSRATPSCPSEMKKEVRRWWEAPFTLQGSAAEVPVC